MKTAEKACCLIGPSELTTNGKSKNFKVIFLARIDMYIASVTIYLLYEAI